MSKRIISFAVPLLLFFGVLALPPESFHMPGLTVLEQRVIAIFLLAAACWILEPIPIFATSVLIIVIELIFISNKGLGILTKSGDENFGKLLSYSDILATFANPVVMLFLGGFFLALGATKYKLDLNLARVILKPFGNRPQWIMMGLMLITALFSMFMSNTATCAMMLAVLTPVLAMLPEGDRGRAGFALAIPVAANVGGMGTPIGTPPNAIAMQAITQIQPLSFGEWMAFAVPYVIILLFLAWLLLCWLFPCKQQKVELVIESRFVKSPKAIISYVTFAVTVILWMLGGIHGMNSYVVGMIPVAVYTCTGVVTKADMKSLSWDVLWLMSGGIALGLALDKTGLAARMVASIPFHTFAPFMVLFSASVLTCVMSNFMSNTATANLLMPLMAALVTGISGLESFGGGVGVFIGVAFGASLGMSLPISTPPNALAMATGTIETRDMAKVGVILGVVGLGMTFVMLWLASAGGLL